MSQLLHSLLADHAVLRLAWHNLSVVVPGKLYRSNHPTPARLGRWQHRLGLRTIINLRGEKPNGSTALTLAAAGRLGLDHVFMAFESRGAPHRERILRFHEIYRAMRTPALIHCKSGADRAGLAAGLAVLFEGGSAEEASRQLSLKHLHFSGSSTGILDAFFHLYADQAEGRKPFLDWVRDDYSEDELRRSFAPSALQRLLNDRVLVRE
jgi:protein tyrosine phosphatase (PTP) superfamily phosphohydrolase (DUF442 family)